MGVGVNAVKSEIMSDFNVTAFAEHFDPDSTSTDLGFAVDGRIFLVRVSIEFDQDYGRGLNVDLSRLGAVLRASKNGKATVRTTGISQGISGKPG